MRPLALIVFAAAAGTIVWSLFGGTISPLVSLAIYGVSALLIVVYFNYLRKHATAADTVWLATGIFVGVVNIFISLLNVFSSR
jgi:modulator of FtsH protease